MQPLRNGFCRSHIKNIIPKCQLLPLEQAKCLFRKVQEKRELRVARKSFGEKQILNGVKNEN